MPQSSTRQDLVALAELRRAGGKSFALTPDPERLRDMAEDLGLRHLRKLRFTGQISPDGKSDWRLEGQLGATVTQACSVTLEDVVTRIETRVLRRYLADLPQIDADEAEMPEDDSIEALPAKIDLFAVMIEDLALALPDYPRSPQALRADEAVERTSPDAGNDDPEQPRVYSASPPNAAPFEATQTPTPDATLPLAKSSLAVLQGLRDTLAQAGNGAAEPDQDDDQDDDQAEPNPPHKK